jgi:hypothetical protein
MGQAEAWLRGGQGLSLRSRVQIPSYATLREGIETMKAPTIKEVEACRDMALGGMFSQEQEFCCSAAESREAYAEMDRVGAVFDYFVRVLKEKRTILP